MDYGRLYSYRFRDVPQEARVAVWKPIASHVEGLMGTPEVMLDPAAGRGEFISSVSARERWAVDWERYPDADYGEGTTFVESDALKADLPQAHFDGVFVSNFLEHLHSQLAISEFLERMCAAAKPGGRIAILGPNYRYCARVYWDFADHVIPLTELAVNEHLYAAGFEPERAIPRYLPYTLTGRLPPSPRLTELYLKMPFAWRLLGKQFLVIGRKPG